MGYMGPFFTEFNLNGQLLPVQYPATYAHEMLMRLVYPTRPRLIYTVI